MNFLQNKRVLIVGLGLIGGSIARGLRSRGLCGAIYACGRDIVPLQQAMTDGTIDGYSSETGSFAAYADIIIIAVPTLTVRKILEQLKGAVKENTIITDVASVKGSVVADYQAVFGEGFHNFVPAHPIAGSEQSGYAASTSDLFVNRKVILTPLAGAAPESEEMVSLLWRSLGADVHCMSVEQHDAVLAATSHLPHLLAYSLVNTLAAQQKTDDIFRYAAGGFAGFTRIASSDPVMWRDIFLANGEATIAVLDAYTTELSCMRKAIVDGDGELMRRSFEHAREIRDSFIHRYFSSTSGQHTLNAEMGAAGSLIPVLTIDGPGGSGKGTVSTRVARELGWHFLDSGALYRLLSLSALRAGVTTNDEPGLLRLARVMEIRFGPNEQVWLDGNEVSTVLRQESTGAAASEVAIIPAVRTALLARQKSFRQSPGLVADGRDMGTVVFPDAQIKVFLTASAEERAKRRYNQLIDKGIDVNLTDLFLDIKARDERDIFRSISPLRPAIDAVVVDTTDMDVEQVVTQVLRLVHQRL